MGRATVLAALAYSLFVIAPLVGSRLDPATSYVSELAARDQPASMLFRLADAGVGLVVVIAGVVYEARTPRPTGRAGFWFAVLGAGTVLDSATPMACAPSADPRCAATEPTGVAALTGPHEWVGVLTNLAAILAMAMVVRAWRRRRPASRPAFLELVSFGSLPVAAAAGLVAVLEAAGLGTIPLGPLGPLGSWVGWAQRAQVLVISLVLLGLGVRLLRPASAS